MPVGAPSAMASPLADRSTGRTCCPGSGSDETTQNGVQGSAMSPAADNVKIGGSASRTPVSTIVAAVLSREDGVGDRQRPLADA